MNTQEQIKALAELDGKPTPHKPTPEEIKSGSYYQYEPNYLSSYDAIIPLISKLDKAEVLDLWDGDPLDSNTNQSVPSPSQLAEALLRATGKWKE